MNAPSFTDLKRLEAILRTLVRRSALELNRRAPSEAELDELVHRELLALTRDFSDDFLFRLAQHVPVEAGAGESDGIGALLWQARLHGVEPGAALPIPLTLRDCAESFCRTDHLWTPLTLDGHRQRLKPFVATFGDRPADSITPPELVEHMMRWPSPSTRRNHWSTLNAFFQWLLRCGLVRENPVPFACARPKASCRPRLIFSPEQARQILEITHSTDQIGFWTLSLFAGLRSREIWRLNRRADPWSAIQLDRGVIDLRTDPCASARRMIPIQPVLRRGSNGSKHASSRSIPAGIG